MPRRAMEKVPWGKVALYGGIGLAALLVYRGLRGAVGGLPSPGDIIGDITGGIGETLGEAGSGIVQVIWELPLGFAEGIGARGWGEKGFDILIGPYLEKSDYIAHLQWTGEPPPTPTDPYGFARAKLTQALVQPKAALGGSSKAFITEAPWREDPTIFAGLGPIQGYPSAEAYLEAQRTKFEEAGLL